MNYEEHVFIISVHVYKMTVWRWPPKILCLRNYATYIFII